MKVRDPNWVGTFSESALKGAGIAFKLDDLENHNNLFAHRSALYFTPTSEIPENWVYDGDIDVTLPLVTPDFNDFIDHRILNSPKIWVDLIQRNLFKIRAVPFRKALITYTRYDCYRIRIDHFIAGTKALTDSLKVRTAGRKDGNILYYFGIIEDDTVDHVKKKFFTRTS